MPFVVSSHAATMEVVISSDAVTMEDTFSDCRRVEWSKQIQSDVTFVLDNADGILESEDRESFIN